MPSAQLIGRMTVATLRAHPPREAGLALGYLTAAQVRIFERWEMAIERADALARRRSPDPDAATVVDAIIFGLLQRDDDNAHAAGRELAAAYEGWKAGRRRLKAGSLGREEGESLATEVLTTAL